MYQWVMYEGVICRVTCMNESCRIWMRHISNINESDVPHKSRPCSFTPSKSAATPHSCVTWLTHTSDVTPSCVRHDSLICVTWLIHVCATWHIHTCDMTQSYVADMTRVTWLITPSRVRRESLIRVTWLTHVCDISNSSVPHNSLPYSITPVKSMRLLTHMCDMTHSYVSHDSLLDFHLFICATGLAHVTHPCVRYVSLKWPLRVRDMTQSRTPSKAGHSIKHDASQWVPWLMHVCDMTHSGVWRDSITYPK